MTDAALALQAAGATVDFNARLVDFKQAYEAYVQNLAIVESGTLRPSHEHYNAVQAERWARKQEWIDFFEDFDVLLCPIMPMAAFPHDHGGERTLTINGEEPPYFPAVVQWAGLAIFSDLPSTVVPVGSAGGLPWGVQIVAAPGKVRICPRHTSATLCTLALTRCANFSDLQTIEVGKMLERMGFGCKPPPGYADPAGATASLATSSKL